MTRAGFLKAMQAALLMTVLYPAPLFAEPALTVRDMLGRAQTQSENRVVKGEVAKINRGEDRSKAVVAVPAKPDSQRSFVVAAVLPPIASVPAISVPTPAAEISHANKASPSIAEVREPKVSAPGKPLISEATASAATYAPAPRPFDSSTVTPSVPAAQIPEETSPIPRASPPTAESADVVAAGRQGSTAQTPAASLAPSIDVPGNADKDAPKVAMPDPADMLATNTKRLASSEPSKPRRTNA